MMNIRFTSEYGTAKSVVENVMLPLFNLSCYAYKIMVAEYINAGAIRFRNMCICPAICNPHFRILIFPCFSLRPALFHTVPKEDIPKTVVESPDPQEWTWRRRLALAYKISF